MILISIGTLTAGELTAAYSYRYHPAERCRNSEISTNVAFLHHHLRSRYAAILFSSAMSDRHSRRRHSDSGDGLFPPTQNRQRSLGAGMLLLRAVYVTETALLAEWENLSVVQEDCHSAASGPDYSLSTRSGALTVSWAKSSNRGSAACQGTGWVLALQKPVDVSGGRTSWFQGPDVIWVRNCHCRRVNCRPMLLVNPSTSVQGKTERQCRVQLLVRCFRYANILGRQEASLNAWAESWISAVVMVSQSRPCRRFLSYPVHNASRYASAKYFEMPRYPLAMNYHPLDSDDNGHVDPRRCCVERRPATDPRSARGRAPVDVVDPSSRVAVLCCYRRRIVRSC